MIFSTVLVAQESAPLSKPQFKFKNLEIDENIKAIGFVTDRQGFIWFIDTKGLYRFDGLDYQLFDSKEDENSLLENNLNSIFIDKKGFIWLGYGGAGASRLDPKTERFLHFPSTSSNKKFDPAIDSTLYLPQAELTDIVEDKFGTIWLTSTKGLFNVHQSEDDHFTLKQINVADFDNLGFYSITIDNQQRLWLGSIKGLFYSTPLTSGHLTGARNNSPLLFQQLILDEKNNSPTVLALMASKSNQLWLSTVYNGIFQVDLSNLEVTPMFSEQLNWSVVIVFQIIQDDYGHIWFATSQGLGLYIEGNQALFTYQHDPVDSTSIKHDTIFGLTIDRQGKLWLAGYTGIQTLDLDSALFKSFYINKYAKGALKEKGVSSVYFDKNNSLWLGGANTGLYQKIESHQQYPKNDPRFINHQEDVNSLFHLATPDIRRMLEDTKGRIWIGTRRNGVYKITPDPNGVLDDKKAYPLLSIHSDSFNASVYNDVIFEDSQYRIWVANYDGIHLYSDDLDSFSQPNIDRAFGKVITTGQINAIAEYNDILFIGSLDGDVFYLLPNAKSFKKLQIKHSDPSSVALKSINRIVFKNNFMWIAANGLGLVKGALKTLDNGRLVLTAEVFEFQHGLNNKAIHGLNVDLDNKNLLWLNTDSGISGFNIQQQRFYNFTELGNVSAKQFTSNCGAQSPSGDIYYCGDDGLVYFSPSEIKFKTTQEPTTVFTQFYVNNEVVRPSLSKTNLALEQLPSPLNEVIGYAKSVTLFDRQNNFAFDFAALDYTDAKNNQYAYMLEGFNDDWILTTAKRRHANYSNIASGAYTFKVKASNSQGVWSETSTQIEIIVLPPWYLTWWAKCLWAGLFLSLIYLLIRFRTRKLQQRSVTLEQAVEKRTAELKQAQKTIVTQEKMSSLGTLSAGIAHEINNPTNFVYGSCQNLEAELVDFKQFLGDLAGDDADEEVLEAFEQRFTPLFEHLTIIGEGAQRIKKIVTGLSVFSRSDCDKMELTSIKQCIETTVQLVNTEYKEVTEFELFFENEPDIYCFPSKINQVLMNLLVNAAQAIKLAKNKPEGYFGKIKITTNIKNNQCVLLIKDNGMGISKEHVSKIFEPFFTTKKVGEGTGLGLAISYEIIQQHHGELKIESKIGIGTTVKLILPIEQVTSNEGV